MAENRLATPEDHLQELRKKQEADRKQISTIKQRMKERAKKIELWASRAALVRRLSNKGVKAPWMCLTEFDKAGVPRALGLAILWKETGIPQRAVFGCDHGSQGGVPPYCGEAVTSERGRAFLRWHDGSRTTRMNGVHWTQTTWYEKVARVRQLSADLTKAEAHLRVCMGDLGILVRAHGVRTAARMYNGSGPAAEAYADDVVFNKMPVTQGWLKG